MDHAQAGWQFALSEMMHFRNALIALPLALITACASTDATDAKTCTAAPHRLCPKDDGPGHAEFDAFRRELATAVQEKNEAKLLKLIDPKIRTSFGDDGGIDEFRRTWRTSSPDSALWNVLARLLGLGGTLRDGMFWAPYVYSAWPDSIDAFENVAAIRAGVPIRKEPSPDAPIVETVDWSILQLMPGTQLNQPWLHVKTGYVRAEDVYSPIGYRAGFSRRSGRWLMEALVAGD